MKDFELSNGTGSLETAQEVLKEADYDLALHRNHGTHEMIVGANDTGIEEACLRALAEKCLWNRPSGIKKASISAAKGCSGRDRRPSRDQGKERANGKV